MLRVRFAPSPTGYLHIGGVRAFISFSFEGVNRANGVVNFKGEDPKLSAERGVKAGTGRSGG